MVESKQNNNAEPLISNISAEPEKAPEIALPEPAPTTSNFHHLKRREPEGGHPDPVETTTNGHRKTSSRTSPAEEELVRMAHDHLLMLE